MLRETIGNLLAVRNGIICHQVNYHGIMGAGIAAAIADTVLPAEQYATYVDYCKRAGRTALGTVQFLGAPHGLVVANLFCQDEALAHHAPCITDYDLMRRCFVQVRNLAQIRKMTVYIPHKIGCGIACGDWETVQQILQDMFADSPVDTVIVRKK